MIHILRETEDFLVCYKDENLDFHNSAESPGFFTLLKEQFPQDTLYPVHRLDKPTSGLILAARSREAAVGLGELLSTSRIEKYYLALSDKKPKKKQGWVIGDMERSRRGQWILTRGRDNPARSYFFCRILEPGLRLFIIRIYTGKTHQIRVAMKSLGSPVLGDPVYYGSGPVQDRMYLHSWKLKFTWKDELYDLVCLPRSGRLFPEDLGAFLEDPSCPFFP
ncbi:TIGR01621 family pseudouridine synthase [Oceanispirochaeta sp.]|jgi:tRNA pseudouridine32 synthase/23S rRNA pseudouridine746 synthase|uniref:TIGR01621 family pseudouridine synthase n=1 Tax=Oceanispirochaeta sp. TaxID=2035350 RepID=UPI002608A477|nr:TIGR01621 family pseudouridine synthase [Oceanispirochaeta sp.]MDA3957713.1 TIGR01621 family pseudouridine synthase [Oceanispirochaeta sp.]